jgi:putative NIF3 family GTP cyclohydrolase 1 type 2
VVAVVVDSADEVVAEVEAVVTVVEEASAATAEAVAVDSHHPLLLAVPAGGRR